MATRALLTRAPSRGNGTPLVDGVVRAAKQGTRTPNHLAHVGNKLPAAATPLPARVLSSIPPSTRAAMRRLTMKGGHSFMGELEPIRLQRDSSHGRAPRAPSSRTRKRDADKKVPHHRVLTDLAVPKFQIADQTKQDATAAEENLQQKSRDLHELESIESDQRVAADRAWSRASSLDKAAKEFAVALEDASFAAGIAVNNEAIARGSETSQKMERKKKVALWNEKQAEQYAIESKELYEDGLLLVNERQDRLRTTMEMLEAAKAAHADAQRMAAILKEKASRAEDHARRTVMAFRVGRLLARAAYWTGDGRGMAPLLLATDVVESVSSFDDEQVYFSQDEPKSKRARP